MDVLNTYGGGTDGAEVAWAMWFGLCTIVLVIGACACLAERYVGSAVLCVVVACVCLCMVSVALTESSEPIRHEVTLREGHVIDAVKYEIIGQRGSIYVIEEREVPEP